MHIRALEPGDIVDIVAPASKCSVAELKAGVKRVESLGLTARVPAGLFGKSLLFSNADAKRLAQLKRAVYAKDSRMIWCVRGGYGAVRLMPEIMKWRRPRFAKIFLGYSDISTLHQHFNQKWGWPTLHGPLLDRFGRESTPEKETGELLGILGGRLRSVEFRGLKADERGSAPRARDSRARLGRQRRGFAVGFGHGRRHFGTWRDFVFRRYRRASAPHGPHADSFCAGGSFSRVPRDRVGRLYPERSEGPAVICGNDVFGRFAAEIGIPVLKGVPAGHNPLLQRTVPFNTRAVLKTGASASLVIDTGIRP